MLSTTTVSASVDTRTKAIANAYIRQAGLTPNEVIRDLWESIAATGKVPQSKESTNSLQKKRRAAFEEAQRVVADIPRGTPLATMSDEEVRKELEHRAV